MPYIIAMILLLAFYAWVIILMPRMRSARLWNTLFTVSVFLFYLNLVYTVYSDVGFYDWNFQNTLPVANVSPFMFTIVPLIHIFPGKIKKHFYLLISLLTVGMLFSAVFNCIYNASIGYKFHPHFMCDYIAHVLLSLWGVYLIKSKQVELKVKNSMISGAILVGVASVMMILNIIFDTAFFGLSLNGKHNIYNNVLTNNSYLSAALYFFGVALVLGMGYVYSYFMTSKTERDNI